MRIIVLFIILSLFNFRIGYSQDLDFSLEGNDSIGYLIQITEGVNPLLNNQGEFSLTLANLDRSVSRKINNWKGSSYKKTLRGFILNKAQYLEEFDANLYTQVEYEKVSPALIKKTFKITQNSIPNFYYSVNLSNIPANTPKRYVSFEHEEFPGGMVAFN